VTTGTPPVTSAPERPDDIVIDLHDAAFGYGERAVLSGASLTIRRGEIVAVVGPNGSGKSTLMKGILGLNDHVSGTVSLFGAPSRDLDDRARLGYVPQRHTLSTSVRATAEEIVSTGRLPRINWLGRLRATDRQIVARSLDVVGLADRAATEVSTLSGGQQRRVLIARALAGQPDVLIMDEPTAGVDAANQHVLADVLDRLVEREVTMVIVTHELGALERLLTRIVVVDGGRIRFDGTPREYAAARDSVHHDHDSHHHDLELEGHDASLAHGPLDVTHPDRSRP
jgi:zinc transport system ATP-binding protein